jgi:phospholipid/cholesterol/gamma-HCH transport system substrate-binding protein
MFFDLDPGTKDEGAYNEGEMIPMANTAPDINLDEILAALDADSQAYLRMLLTGAGQGLDGRAKELGELLGSLGPLNRDFAALNKEIAKRRDDLSELMHSFNVLTTRVGKAESELTKVVSSSREALGTIAAQDPSVRRAIRLLPGTLTQAETTLTSISRFADVLGPAFNDLRPFARNLDELNASNVDLAEAATPAVRDEIRPFVRQAREPLPDLRVAAQNLASAAPRFKVIFKKLNTLFNMAANNPNGAEPAGTPGRDEGYLYWTAWLGHNTDSMYSVGDGNGFFRRIYLSMGCQQANELIRDPNGAVSPLSQIVSGLTDSVLDTACNP